MKLAQEVSVTLFNKCETASEVWRLYVDISVKITTQTPGSTNINQHVFELKGRIHRFSACLVLLRRVHVRIFLLLAERR